MKIKPQDWFGIRFCASTPGSKSLRALYQEYALEKLAFGRPNPETTAQHLIDTNRRHYLLTKPALAEMALLPVKQGFNFQLLDCLPKERGCLLLSPKRFIRYHVTKEGLFVVDLNREEGNDGMLQWAIKWVEGETADRTDPTWFSIEVVVQALAFLHLSEPSFIEMPPMATKNMAYRLLSKGNTDNETAVSITRVGAGWNQFLVDGETGKVRGHVRLARVGKGWMQRRLVPVRPHERTRKIESFSPPIFS